MKSPYPWFGGKSKIMGDVWSRLGDTPNFVDPFLGSNAPLLSRPGWDCLKAGWADGRNRIETVNDKDKFVANFWRALNDDPERVAHFADWPVNEADLHARHRWLVENQSFVERMSSDPHYYDPQVAGWWVWGLCQWIGPNWCKTLKKQRPNLGNAGVGVHRASQQMPNLCHSGMGVHRASFDSIYEYFQILSARLRRVRVCCGDWLRVLGPTPTEHSGLTAIILDPPYSAEAERHNDIYPEEDLEVAHPVREWAIANGDNPKLRIALFGYEAEHAHLMPGDWEMLAWKTRGGLASRSNGQGVKNKLKERVWFSPHCLKVEKQTQLSLLPKTLI